MYDGRYPLEVVNGVPVVTAPEEIDITNAPALRSALLAAAAHGNGTLVVDMTRTQFCDSSGLHTLLAAHKRAQAEGGGLLLAITAAPVLRVLAMTTIDRMIPTFTSVGQALAQAFANEPAVRLTRRSSDNQGEDATQAGPGRSRSRSRSARRSEALDGRGQPGAWLVTAAQQGQAVPVERQEGQDQGASGRAGSGQDGGQRDAGGFGGGEGDRAGDVRAGEHGGVVAGLILEPDSRGLDTKVRSACFRAGEGDAAHASRP
jgi:anti-sigma B factor antagonist